MSGGRMIHATYKGQSYEIPEVWLMGFCCARGADDGPRTMQEAVAWWAWQCELAERDVMTARELVDLIDKQATLTTQEVESR